CSRRLSTLHSSLLPSRLLLANWIETRRGIAGKDESQLLTPFNSAFFPHPTTMAGKDESSPLTFSLPSSLPYSLHLLRRDHLINSSLLVSLSSAAFLHSCPFPPPPLSKT
ncbi:hypothetical protein PRIPAC_81148, partial [Pristionchus pacificus]|uniref:Uncharacterized protein n=1 Tax=Pristionchus pacificus TaxID=54126 RepID=A0A2A6C2Z4_PRIPA